MWSHIRETFWFFYSLLWNLLMFGNNALNDTVLWLWWSNGRKNSFVINEIIMKINKHWIINIQVSQGKFDVINRWCHAEVNQTYPTCAFIKFIFRVKIFCPFMMNVMVDGKLKYTQTHISWTCEFISVSHQPYLWLV